VIKKFLFIILFVLFFAIAPKVLAQEEFSTSYDTTYDVGSDGITAVKEKITLKNLTSKYYASNFILTIGSTEIIDLKASDDAGPMEVNLEHKDNTSIITAKFNQQVAGLNKSQTFNLSFKSKDFTQNIGRTWEVNLPKIPESSNISNYNLVLSVPVAFGDPTSISPSPKSESQTFDRLFFTFSKNQITKSGISVNFGTAQVFDFILKYNLENNSLFPIMTSIVIPPDTAYQDILINNLKPNPVNVTVDEDGNWLAWYRLPRRSKQEVVVIGSAKLYIKPKSNDFLQLSQQQSNKLIKGDEFWETNNPAILSTLTEIFSQGTPKQNREKTRLIYQYVVSHLKYDTSRLNNNNIERLGAVTALNNPNSAVCMEFTDLLITLLRANKIPARELDGFAYSQNSNLRPLSLSKDLLHAWVEYFDEQKGWVMVDPTWENSSGGVDYFNKFDLNHLVFAIKGISSKMPYVSDDVKVTVSENDFLGKPQIVIESEAPSYLWAGFPANLSVTISNQGNSIQSPITLTINTNTIKVLNSHIINLNSIPPLGSTTHQFSLRTPFIWQETRDSLEINLGSETITKQVTIKPFFMFIPIPVIFLSLGITVAGIYIIILGIHFYRKRGYPPKNSVSK